MKHTWRITLILTLMFISAQVIGLLIVNEYIDHQETVVSGEPQFEELPFDMARPEVEGEGGTAVVLITVAIIIGTLLLLLIMKLKGFLLWKVWFFVAITFALTIALSPFVSKLFFIPAEIVSLIALIIAVTLAYYKIFKQHMVIQNIVELFVYGGLAVMFVSLFDDPSKGVLWAFVLLVLISVYDFIAVHKTKHMVSMAKFQTKSKVFAGLMVPYKLPKKKKKRVKVKAKVKTAILGGGDIAFPLIFSGAVMQNLMISNIEIIGFLKTLVITLFATLSLLLLLYISKKDKFYPAMPFLTGGCFVGYLILFLF